jgi:hypothetical protein
MIHDLRFLKKLNFNIDSFLVKEPRSFVVSNATQSSISTISKVDPHNRLHTTPVTNLTIWQRQADTQSIESSQLASRASMRSVVAFKKRPKQIWEVNRIVKAPPKRQSTMYLNWANVIMHGRLVVLGCGLSVLGADNWFALNCRRQSWIQRLRAALNTSIRSVGEMADPIPREYATLLATNTYNSSWELFGRFFSGCKGRT